MRRGSITPFCAVSLMLITSLLFVLLEGARVYGLDCYADMKAEAGMDSVCGEYQPFLWQQYGLLFLDGAYGTEFFSMNYITESLENHLAANCDTSGWLQEELGLDLFQLRTDELLVEGYSLATDGNGEVFLKYVAERAKENLSLGIAEDLYENYQAAENLEKQHGGVEESIWEAKTVLAEVEAEWELKQEENTGAGEESSEEEIEKPDISALANVLDNARRMQNSSMLNMIFADLSQISKKEDSLSVDLQHRKREEGTLHFDGDSGWYQKLLVLHYMEDFFSNYFSKKEGHFLSYEMEYVACGKDSDWENLEGVLKKIMIIREASNVAYLLQDEEKMALAGDLAGMVGLMAGENPGVVKVIQIGIIGAWAYMESVLDIRALVAGERIPLMKKEREWTTELTNLWSVFDKEAKAKMCEEGLSYVDYLKQVLFTMNNQKLAYRMMEVMEIGMRQVKAYENCRMDQMLVALQYKVRFRSQPVFALLVSVGEKYEGNYYFSKNVKRSYIP